MVTFRGIMVVLAIVGFAVGCPVACIASLFFAAYAEESKNEGRPVRSVFSNSAVRIVYVVCEGAKV